MESMKMIRCFLGKPTPRPESADGAPPERSVRFIPLEEFELWKFMMENKHGLSVSDASVSVWVDQEEFDRLRAVYARAATLLKVRKLSFFAYSEEDSIDYQATRFVAQDECEKVKEIILGHLREGPHGQRKHLVVQETEGFWLQQ